MSADAPKTILVLDDDAGVVDFLTESLTELGYRTVGLTSPVDALARIRMETFDLVITDVEMPMMRGTDLLAAILQAESARAAHERVWQQRTRRRNSESLSLRFHRQALQDRSVRVCARARLT
jgi:CheY-like chemotaxis protein